MSSYRAASSADDGTLSQHSGVPSSKRVPGYAAPTTSQHLPEYTNAEADAIRSSFSTGNYRTIAHLPTELKAHHISEATASRIDDNITSSYFVAPHGSYRRFGAKDALFSSFDYMPEEYSLASKLSSAARQQHEEKRLKVNPLPFLYSTPRPLLVNGLAGSAAPDENARYAGQDVYESSEEQHRRAAFLDSQKIRHGPFVPSTGSHSIGDDKIIRLKLPDIVSKLMRELDADWGDTSFQIYADAEDLIIVQFEAASIDNAKGLLAYMNMFVKSNKVVSECALAKLVELWNHPSDSCIYYAFRPPFSRRRVEESMFTLHPELAKPGGKFVEGKTQQRIEEEHAQMDQQLRLTDGSKQVAPQQQQQTPAQSSAAADREQMADLVAAFDAGLQPRRATPKAGPLAK